MAVLDQHLLALPVSDEQRAAEAVGGLDGARASVVVQAGALLLAADGVANEEIARRFSGSPTRCGGGGRGPRRSGWVGGPRRGAPVVAAGGHGRRGGPVDHVRDAADALMNWTTRSMAAEWDRQDAVARIRADHDLKPWQVDMFKVSNDPRFEEKRRRRGRPVPNPRRGGGGPGTTKDPSARRWTEPSRACRSSPGRGMMTHDDKRNGTIAVRRDEPRDREVLTDERKIHAATDVRAASRRSTCWCRGPAIHVVLENLSGAERPEITTGWSTRTAPLHPHFTLMSTRGQPVERWSRKSPTSDCGGRFTSVAETEPRHHRAGRCTGTTTRSDSSGSETAERSSRR